MSSEQATTTKKQDPQNTEDTDEKTTTSSTPAAPDPVPSSQDIPLDTGSGATSSTDTTSVPVSSSANVPSAPVSGTTTSTGTTVSSADPNSPTDAPSVPDSSATNAPPVPLSDDTTPTETPTVTNAGTNRATNTTVSSSGSTTIPSVPKPDATSYANPTTPSPNSTDTPSESKPRATDTPSKSNPSPTDSPSAPKSDTTKSPDNPAQIPSARDSPVPNPSATNAPSAPDLSATGTASAPTNSTQPINVPVFTLLLPNPDVRAKTHKSPNKSPKKNKKSKKSKASKEDDEELQRLAEAINKNEELPPSSRTQSMQDASHEAFPKLVPRYDADVVEKALGLCRGRYQLEVTIRNPKPEYGFQTLGISEEGRKLANKKLFQSLIDLEQAELIGLTERLWQQPERDFQYLAMDFLKHATVTILRSAGHEELFTLLKYLVTTKSRPDTVDKLAKMHLTTLAYLEPAETWPRMDQWITDPDPWLQRAAILHQYGLGDFADRGRLFRHCEYQFMKAGTRDSYIIDDAIDQALERFAETYHISRTPSGVQQTVDFIHKNLGVMEPIQRRRLCLLKLKLERWMEEERLQAEAAANQSVPEKATEL